MHEDEDDVNTKVVNELKRRDEAEQIKKKKFPPETLFFTLNENNSKRMSYLYSSHAYSASTDGGIPPVSMKSRTTWRTPVSFSRASRCKALIFSLSRVKVLQQQSQLARPSHCETHERESRQNTRKKCVLEEHARCKKYSSFCLGRAHVSHDVCVSLSDFLFFLSLT
jgi:hypothetical protein